jgi:DNA-binding LacI/PurR family transcriptional regulator
VTVKFHIARERVINYIAGNGFEKGAKLPNEKEFAAICGVSIITLRRALAELEANNLVERIHGRGTFVNMNLRNSPLDKHLLFVSIGKVSEGRYSDMLLSIEEEAAKRGCRIEYLQVGEQPETSLLTNLADCKGMILFGWVTRAWADYAASLRIPAVAVSLEHFNPAVSTVTYDYAGMSRLLLERMIERGARNIGTTFPANSPYHSIRLIFNTYQSVLKEHGLPLPPPKQPETGLSREGLYTGLEEFFAGLPEPLDGIFVAGSAIYVNLLNFLLEHPSLPRPLIGVLQPLPGYRLESARLKNTISVIQESYLPEKVVELLFSGNIEHVLLPGKLMEYKGNP